MVHQTYPIQLSSNIPQLPSAFLITVYQDYIYVLKDSLQNSMIYRISLTDNNPVVDNWNYAAYPNGIVLFIDMNDNAYIYYSEYGGNILRKSILDNTVNSVSTGLSTPIGLTIDSQKTNLYILDYQLGNINKLVLSNNGETSAIIEIVYSGFTNPTSLKIDPEDTFLYVSHSVYIAKINLITNVINYTWLNVGESVYQIEIDSDNKFMYIPLSNVGKVSKVNIGQNIIVNPNYINGSNPIGVCLVYNKLFVSNVNGIIDTYLIQSNAPVSYNIQQNNYPTLRQYAVLSGNKINFNALGDTLTIKSSTLKYGAKELPIDSNGIITGGILDNASVNNALNDLHQLVADISFVTSVLPTSQLLTNVIGNISLMPFVNYYNNSGSITFGDNTQDTTITFDGQNNPNSQFFITTGNGCALSFVNITEINLINGAKIQNIFWNIGQQINFSLLIHSFYPGIFIAESITLMTPNTNIYGRIFTTISLNPGEKDITFIDGTIIDPTFTQNIVCYAKGTMILTKNGFIPIENIRLGNKIITKGKIRNGKYVKYPNYKIEKIIWAGKFRVRELNLRSRPICIKKNALGKNIPFKDLYVSPKHNIIIHGMMVQANNMVNGTTIYQDNECSNVEYYHIECETHSAILANGVLSESYLDMKKNRIVFDNVPKLCIKH